MRRIHRPVAPRPTVFPAMLPAMLLAMLLAVPVLHAPAAFAQERPVKIGYIDIEEINRNYSKIINAVELLNDVLEQRQKELDIFYARVEEAHEKAEEKRQQLEEGGAGAPTRTEVRNLELDAQELARQYRQQFDDRALVFEQAKNEILYPILVEVTEAVREVGDNGGYSVIIKKDLARYSNPKNDVTGQVLRILEQNAAADREEERERLESIEARID